MKHDAKLLAAREPAPALENIGAIARAVRAHAPDTAPSAAAAHHAAVALALRDRPGGPGLEALVIKRAEHPEDPWSGHMALPGGRREADDAHLEAAARRETLEELGLALDREMLLGRLDDAQGERLRMIGMSLSPFVYHCPRPGALRPDPAEVAEAFWIPLSFFTDPGNLGVYRYPPDPLLRDFPAFSYGAHVIWGLTYGIITNFLGLFGHSFPDAHGETRLPPESPPAKGQGRGRVQGDCGT